MPVASEFVADGFNDPLFLTSPPGDTTRLFVLEQAGLIRIIKNGTLLGTPFIDLTGVVNQGGGERGLLGLAFHPNYPTTPYFYVNYVDQSAFPGDTVIARYEVSGNLDLASGNAPTVLLTFDQEDTNHNGGWMGFGPNDDYLYISTGDGGGSNDPNNNGQSINTLLGKMLRLDVDAASPYTPATNPFFGATPGDDRIWAYGLRNPWRCSFDRSNGDLWIGDVGQGTLEEIDFQGFASSGGENYGWDIAEGFECRGGGGTCGTNPGFTPPVHDYPRTDGQSVTGGYVYRGTAIGGLQGTYFFADYIFGTIWSFDYNGTVNNFTDRSGELDPPGRTINNVSAFGEDANGELYIIDYSDGEIFKIIGTDPDTDGDGLSDSQEGTYGTGVNDPDSDDDGLLDGAEVFTHNTDPLDDDSDNDGLLDGAEVNTHGTDPNDSDSDNDGLSDGAEINTYGSDPNDSDSDNDGLSDGAEVNTHGSNPNSTDSDGDGITDGTEVNTYGTDPSLADTDGDGVHDGTEISFGSDPLDPFDFPPLPAAGMAGLALLMTGLTAYGVHLLKRRRTANP